MELRKWIAGCVCTGLWAVTYSCREAARPQYGDDFTDKVVDLVLEARNGQHVAFPDLYERNATRVPAARDDHFILADKLALRGFTESGRSRQDAALSGLHVNIVDLEKDSCRCEVSKIYASTRNIGEFTQSEAIRCENTGLKTMP